MRLFHSHPELKRLLSGLIVFALVVNLSWPYVQAWATSADGFELGEELVAAEEEPASAGETGAPIEAIEDDDAGSSDGLTAPLEVVDSSASAQAIQSDEGAGMEGEPLEPSSSLLSAGEEDTYSESNNLGDFLTFWSITVGDTTYTDDNVDENTVIEFKDGMQYSLELKFAEKPNLGFQTSEENPPPMYYQLPDCIAVPSDYKMLLNVNLGRKGTLPDNKISVYRDTGSDGNEHTYLKLEWNWEDSHWDFFRDSAQAKLNVVVSGTFRDEEPHVLSINGKDVAVRREDLHNAIVNKEGTFHKDDGIIDYRVTVRSDGTTSDITLTDTLGSALYYLSDEGHNGGVVLDTQDDAYVNSANTVPQITQRTGNTFNVVIPEMNDGDCLVFRYSAIVDYDSIAVSGNPSFEETGNTAEVFGDSYTLDNRAMYHETDIDFSDLEKNVIGKRRISLSGNYAYILTWEIDTNKRAQYPLADSTITDTISPVIQSFSKYYGDGVTVQCYSDGGDLAETRHLAWEELGVDLEHDVTWTYHIPETDPLYRYKLTYDSIVYMDGQTSTVVAENTAEGKGGIDSDRAVLPTPGKGIGITKQVVDQDSTHVTWEVRLTVSGVAFDYERIVLTEHMGTKNNGTTWNTDALPGKWLQVPGEAGAWYKEVLQKVEVLGLEEDETFEVLYGRSGVDGNGQEYPKTTFYPHERGVHVLEEDFGREGSKWSPDYCRLEFYKDFERNQPGLTNPNPNDDSASRTIIIRYTNEFPEAWAAKARQQMLESAKLDSSLFAHVNWISVEAPDSTGKLTTRAFDTDKIEPMPPQLYKTVLETVDTTLLSDTDSAKLKWLLGYPNCVLKPSNTTETGKLYRDLPVFPCFRYQVLVTGIKYDEPLVIEDTFDTSLFDVITADDFPGGRYLMSYESKTWTHTYFMKAFGMKNYGWITSGQANYNGTEPNYVTYGFGFDNKNYYHKAEDYGCTLEKTDTGFRVTINELFRDPQGNLFPYYGIDYYLVPKNLEALKTIEEMARANGASGGEYKAAFTNTATARGISASSTVKIGITNDFMPIDKTSETYLDLLNPYQGQYQIKLDETQMGGTTVRDTPDGITPNDIQRYVMKYRVVLNKGRERLNDGNEITAEDEYSNNLAVDFTTIKITTEPESAASQVSYDYSGNIGYFTIPDETKVVIEYEATVLQTTPAVVATSNEVRMLQYKKTVDDYVDHGGASGSSATNPSILVKKYGAGHMETGLNGAQFQLYEYNHATYENGDSNTAADWTPVVLTKPEAHYAVFTTHDMTVADTYYGHGYAEIELRQDTDGTTLQTGKVYGLREITTPTATATNGDVINYQSPHDDSFYCYIFTICKDDETADYANYVYLPDDTMTVRNTPESLALHLSKHIEGNCEPNATEKALLRYQIFRKEAPEEGQTPIYMPIMTEERDPATGQYSTVIDSRFTNITYSQVAESSGVELTGLTVASGTTVGEYLLVEYGNNLICLDHPDWTWSGVYEWNDGTRGTFSASKAYTVYDHDGQNPTQVYGIPFTVTSREIRDAENKSVSITNRYSREEINLTAKKVWQSPGGATISWPAGKSVTFELGTLDETGMFVPVSGMSVVLDNTKDNNGEETAGTASFKRLPKYASDGMTVVRYAVREVAPVPGYYIVYPALQSNDPQYAVYGSATNLTIKNRAQSTSIGVTKAWVSPPDGATSATLRLYSYTGNDPSTATWVSNVNDIVLDGVVDEGAGEEDFFGEDVAWHASFTGLPIYDANSQQLHYVVREIACTPASFEPTYAGDKDYAVDGETITNALATTSFSVSKEWRGISGWPAGKGITFDVKRLNPSTGEEDQSFTASYTLSQGTIVCSTGSTEGVTASWTSGTLTLTGLEKYVPAGPEGTQWRYIATEQDLNDDDYETTYHDKSGYLISGASYTYNGGTIRNTLAAKKFNLSFSKTVTGNMGDKTKAFGFDVTLTKKQDEPFVGTIEATKYADGSSTGQTVAVTFVNGHARVQMKHGESILLPQLVGVVGYAIEEDQTNYDVSYQVNDESLVEGELSASGTLTKDTTVAFTNRREMHLPLGVNDDGAAASVLALLAAAVVAFVARGASRRARGIG